MKRVIIDTDGGTDDALAVLLALRSPELRVEAITTVCGNVEVQQATRNILRTLELLHEGVGQGETPMPSVAQGAAAPLVQPLRTALEVHGSDGIGNISGRRGPGGELLYPEPQLEIVPQNAHELLLTLLGDHPGDISIITLGPLTNLALAAERDADTLRMARELIIMGGAFKTYGNVTLAAEFNIYVDPDAAKIVLGLGIASTIVPLDVTDQVVMTRAMLDPFLGATASPLARFVADSTEVVMAFQSERSREYGCTMHDPLAVAVACDPQLTQMVQAPVLVETVGEYTAGQTIADLRPHRPPRRTSTRTPCNICVSVDAERFFQLFTTRVLRG